MNSQDDVRVNLKEARAIGNQLHIDFTLINPSENEIFNLNTDEVLLFDESGTAYEASSIIIGNREIVNGIISYKLMQNIPVKLKIIFTGAPSKMTNVKTLLVSIERAGDKKALTRKFIDIKIPLTENKKIIEASKDSRYMEIEPGVFGRLMKVERSGNILIMELAVENTENDKEVSLSTVGTRLIDNSGHICDVNEIDFSGIKTCSGDVAVMMPKNVMMKLIFNFNTIHQNAFRVNVFEFSLKGNIIQIKDINI